MPSRRTASARSRIANAPRWLDPRQAAPAFCLRPQHIDAQKFEPPRTNYFRIWWIETGTGTFDVSAGRYPFAAGELLFFVPYQQVKFAAKAPWDAVELQFHANFLCVETFHAETGCSGSLFNDLYGPPVVRPADDAAQQVQRLLQQLAHEQTHRPLAFEDASLSLLKLLLITATREKAQRTATCGSHTEFQHPLLAPLRELIEEHYRTLHSPQDYAELLHVTAKTLGRAVREHLGKTLTDLIRERMLTHAKWQLLHTLRPVKEIARELGFQDELYFSRLFKKETGVSPKFFREFETEIRGGSNLSMTLSAAPIRE